MTTTTNTRQILVNVAYRIDPHALVEAVCESGFETYGWYDEVVYFDDYDMPFDVSKLPNDLTLPFVRIEIDDPNNADALIERSLSVGNIVEAFEAVVRIRALDGHRLYCDVQDLDIDADFGDQIIQHALLGNVNHKDG